MDHLDIQAEIRVAQLALNNADRLIALLDTMDGDADGDLGANTNIEAESRRRQQWSKANHGIRMLDINKLGEPKLP